MKELKLREIRQFGWDHRARKSPNMVDPVEVLQLLADSLWL